MECIPCPLCGDRLSKRTDKHLKPYFVCNACGIQLFIRGSPGIKRLEEFFRTAKRYALPFEEVARKLYEVQAMLNEIDGTKKQITKLNHEIGFFFPNEEKIQMRNSLQMRRENLLHELHEMCSKRMQSDDGGKH